MVSLIKSRLFLANLYIGWFRRVVEVAPPPPFWSGNFTRKRSFFAMFRAVTLLTRLNDGQGSHERLQPPLSPVTLLTRLMDKVDMRDCNPRYHLTRLNDGQGSHERLQPPLSPVTLLTRLNDGQGRHERLQPPLSPLTLLTRLNDGQGSHERLQPPLSPVTLQTEWWTR